MWCLVRSTILLPEFDERIQHQIDCDHLNDGLIDEGVDDNHDDVADGVSSHVTWSG